MIPYIPTLRPVLREKHLPPGTLPEPIGTACPVCDMSMQCMVLPNMVEHADGSATATCPRCRAPLRQNAEGFVFLEK